MLVSTSASTPAPLLQATALPKSTSKDISADYSSLCQSEISTSAFTLACEGNTISILENKNRRETDISLFREYEMAASQFSLEADIISTTAEDAENDQNTYGFYFVDEENRFQAVRIQDIYYNFESGIKTAELEVKEQLEQSYSPYILSSGQVNHWNLICSQKVCELYANGNLISRLQITTSGRIQSVGFFTASAKDELFGDVIIRDLVICPNDALLEDASFSLKYDLKSGGQELFAHTGFSGAFHDYEEDGFHFSPVVAYNYYAAKTDPSMENVEVSAAVKMDIDPGQSGSQFGGLICRASQAGMYMAVIGVDGTYSIYRNTPDQPFVLLAENTSKAILTGTEENELRLVCSGEEISFYINEQLAASVTDSRDGLSFGRSGLTTKAGGDPQSDAIVFSDFAIREIE